MENTTILFMMNELKQHKGYLVMPDDLNETYKSDSRAWMAKEYYGSFLVIELIDADAMTDEDIKLIMEHGNKTVNRLDSKHSNIYFSIFFFSSPIPATTLALIKKLQEWHFWQRQYHISFAVRTDTQEVIKLSRFARFDFLNSFLPKTMKKIGTSSVENELILDSLSQPIIPEEELPEPVVQTPVITYSLIAINIIIFVIGQYLYVRMNSEAIFVWGAKINPLIMAGQYWRLITPIFLHAGATHLIVNAYSLYAVGPTVEKMYGRVKFIIIYLAAGILGNVASFAFCPMMSIGASGAIFGLLGALLHMGIKYKEVISSTFIINIVSMIAINLGYGFITPQIDNFAHMGGLVGGYLSAYILGLGTRNGFYKHKTLGFLLLCILLVLGIVIGTKIYIG